MSKRPPPLGDGITLAAASRSTDTLIVGVFHNGRIVQVEAGARKPKVTDAMSVAEAAIRHAFEEVSEAKQ